MNLHREKNSEITSNTNTFLLENAIDKMLALRQQELTLIIEYKDKYLEVINIRQLAELYRSEVEFRKNLLKRFSEE